MDAGHETVRCAHVRQRRNDEIGLELQPNVPFEGANANGQALARVAVREIRRVEVRGRERPDRQGNGTVGPTGVVHGPDPDLAALARVVDDAHEPLPVRIGRGQHHRRVLAVPPGARGQVRQVARRALEETENVQPPVGLDPQPPLPNALAEPPGQILRPLLEFLRGDDARRPGRQAELDSAFGRRIPPVVDGDDHDIRRFVLGVHQAQSAHLVAIAARVEEGKPVDVHVPPAACLEHAGDEAVRSAHVGQCLELEVGFDFQPPISRPGSDTLRQSLFGVAVFQVRGIEVHCGEGIQMDGDQGIPAAGIVDRRDLHIARILRLVENADESLLSHIRGRRNERNCVGARFRIRREPPGDRPRSQYPRGC